MDFDHDDNTLIYKENYAYWFADKSSKERDCQRQW
jgi:hypothetical protein